MEKTFIYLSFVMAGVFVLMALGLFFLPSGIFEGWTTSSRIMMGSAILLYAGFRVFRARKMLQRHKESEKEYLNRLEKDE
jgi:ABC-type uncharacterized transport system permease subunit